MLANISRGLRLSGQNSLGTIVLSFKRKAQIVNLSCRNDSTSDLPCQYFPMKIGFCKGLKTALLSHIYAIPLFTIFLGFGKYEMVNIAELLILPY